ncbi:2-amino-4-hydroxy-6-hydroxymethyldihydropteridine diphosphokinase [Anaerolentibacter hominis]|uniref:2-amino-4-hydroxy-6- hydroxymethyldihydropteridine diphosphokinase n=1 Tax=Anaerolentibacter hominis TaxID=3079009 RepID=UPI0031B827AE
MDKIKIRDLDIYGFHGVMPEENVVGQRFLICADLMVDTRAAGESDDLSKSVHYGDVCHWIKGMMTEHTYQLIERAAEELAEGILIHFPLVRALRLEVKKPQAPVGLPFGMISVEIERGWKRAALSFGSNLGDKKGQIDEAIKQLSEDEKIRVLKVSDYIVTEPWGNEDQDEFVNGALILETLYSPLQLLHRMQQVEQNLKRTREVHWGPRTIDLDMIFYEDEITGTEELTLPHPYMQERMFVLEPLAQIAPGMRHPVFGQTVFQLREQLKRQEEGR